MLEVGGFRARSCDGLSRRAFLGLAASVPAALGLPAALHAASGAANARKKNRSVLMVWLWGGPSHLDTFDPKPDAPSSIRGPFATLPTRVPGIHFTELLPRLAARNDRFAVVRSCRFAANHDMMPLTGGRGRGPSQPPNFGSVVARRRSVTGMPSFVSVAPITSVGHGFKATSVPGHGAGRLGSAYNPFIVKCSAAGETDIAGLKLLDGLDPERLASRRALREELTRVGHAVEALDASQWNQQVEGAYALLTSGGAGHAFDLGREPAKVRDAYGRTTFGQSLLLGRRLVEAGVPYVQVNWSLGVDGLQEGSNMGWDTHRNGFGQLFNYHCPIFDRAFSALLDDLSDRGLLDDTLVVAMGEMGRSPEINKVGGREHWATCSTLWAGGGVRGGTVVGQTDAKGGEPVTRPITPVDVGTTIVAHAGVDAEARAELGVLGGGQVIHELF